MKQRDLIVLVLAVVIFAVAGYIAFTQLGPQSSSANGGKDGVVVEVIGSINADLDSATIDTLKDQTKVIDYNLPVEFTNLNNTAPFGR